MDLQPWEIALGVAGWVLLIVIVVGNEVVLPWLDRRRR